MTVAVRRGLGITRVYARDLQASIVDGEHIFLEGRDDTGEVVTCLHLSPDEARRTYAALGALLGAARK